jgi:hypothetical protein
MLVSGWSRDRTLDATPIAATTVVAVWRQRQTRAGAASPLTAFAGILTLATCYKLNCAHQAKEMQTGEFVPKCFGRARLGCSVLNADDPIDDPIRSPSAVVPAVPWLFSMRKKDALKLTSEVRDHITSGGLAVLRENTAKGRETTVYNHRERKWLLACIGNRASCLRGTWICNRGCRDRHEHARGRSHLQ